MGDSSTNRSESGQPLDSPSEPIVLPKSNGGHSVSVSVNRELKSLVGELRSRWKQGDRVRVESLGDAFANIASSDEQMLDVIYHEILIREEFGETPRLDEYVSRFPQHAERLQRLFLVHRVIEEDDWSKELAEELDDESDAGEELRTAHRGQPSSTDWGDDNVEHDRRRWPRKSRDARPVEPPPGYELLEEIGRGGMAVVFRARQLILNRIVALKMLTAGNVASQEVLARLRQEAQAVAQLQHPGVVQIHEVGEHRGLPYLSLEFVPGGTLHEWLDGQPLPPLDAARVVEQLARTTHFAHERGIVHRDLKPANVLLTERPYSRDATATIPLELSRSDEPTPSDLMSVKISDFGLARVLGSRSDLTAVGQVIGTPSYMAPEQAAGASDEARPALDIYSLGAILYELLTGRPPFRGATLLETLEQVRHDDPVPPRLLQPRTPIDLETICLKCLERDPQRRYPTALALAEDLRRLQNGETISARPAGTLERTWKWARRYPAIASLIVLAILLTIGGTAGISWEARRASQKETEARRDRDLANSALGVARSERVKADEQRAIAEKQTAVAEAQRQMAVEQKKVAEQQKSLAESEKVRAVAAQALAETNFQRAMKAIHSLLSLDNQLQNEPKQLAARLKINQELTSFFESAAADRSGDDSPQSWILRILAVSSLIRTGEIYSLLRENKKAEETFRRAAEINDGYVRMIPRSYLPWELAAQLFRHQGNLHRNMDRPTDALQSYRRSIAAHDALLKMNPKMTSYLVTKANVIVNECETLKQLGHIAETPPRYEEALAILRRAVQSHPELTNGPSELSLCLHEYSKSLRALHREDEAAAAFQEALDLRLKESQRDPESVGNRVFLAKLYTTKGTDLRQAGRAAESLEPLKLASDLMGPLAKTHSDVYDHQISLVGAWIEQLNTHLILADAANGKAAWRQIIGRLQSLRVSYPNEPHVAHLLTQWQPAWADHLHEDGFVEEARQANQSAIDAAQWLLAESSTAASPQEVSLSNVLAWRMSVAPDASQRDLDKAIALAKRAVSLSPNRPDFFVTLGAAESSAKNHEAARAALIQALVVQSGSNRPSSEDVARILKTLPSDAAAREQFEKSLGLPDGVVKDQPQLFCLLAMTYWQLGDQDAARSALNLVSVPAGFSRSGPEIRRLIQEARMLIRPMTSGLR